MLKEINRSDLTETVIKDSNKLEFPIPNSVYELIKNSKAFGGVNKLSSYRLFQSYVVELEEKFNVPFEDITQEDITAATVMLVANFFSDKELPNGVDSFYIDYLYYD